ncbi:hypothetical protein QFZ33_000390 [Arthrobacter globiformis]|nr:hypothetical protein [Arthrobacter globiformis]
MGSSFLVTTAIPDPGLQLLSDAGTVTVLPSPPDYERLAALCASGEYDLVLTQLRDVIDAPLLAGAQVKGVSNFAVGYNNIDVDAATRHGILVGNTPRGADGRDCGYRNAARPRHCPPCGVSGPAGPRRQVPRLGTGAAVGPGRLRCGAGPGRVRPDCPRHRPPCPGFRDGGALRAAAPGSPAGRRRGAGRVRGEGTAGFLG